ncbi:MAG: aminodeoxychorismate/anthranilate synthase component II [Saprospiraceae bacterium]|nr:aminodeoxychorismate/anthranilate synthase component II [Saprospiraceae bacterium]
MNILLIDNYDSFTYNLVQEITNGLGQETRITVVRNDTFDLEDVPAYEAVILSPGPGIPSEAGLMPQLLRQYAHRIPILGICLGHQAIGECFGATLLNLDQVMHGVATEVQIVSDPAKLFAGLGNRFEVGRYHSWVINPQTLPDCLEVLALDDADQIMAIRHREYEVTGLQFHPESILTPDGKRILQNFFLGLSANTNSETKPQRVQMTNP